MPCQPVGTVERVNNGNIVIALASKDGKLCLGLLGIDTPDIAHGTSPRPH